jgi:hypothetical protein
MSGLNTDVDFETGGIGTKLDMILFSFSWLQSCEGALSKGEKQV